jgi:thymidine kinase
VAEVGYEVLCRRHHMRRMTRASARAVALSPDVLPLDLDLCPLPPSSATAATAAAAGTAGTAGTAPAATPIPAAISEPADDRVPS